MKPLELMEQGRFLGEEFLIWLWQRSMTEGGQSGEDGDFSGLFVDDQLTVVSERGEVKQIALSKGKPSEIREAFEALARGMRPSKLKIRILSGDLEWVGTLDAAQLHLKGLRMPPSTGKAPQERLHDRIFLLEEGHGHLDRRFKAFLAERVDDNGEAMAQRLKEWIQAGAQGEAMPEIEAPWQQPGPAGVSPQVREAVQNPGVRKAMSKFMKGIAEHGTTVTMTTPHDGQSVTITPQDATRALKRLRGAP